MEILRAKWEEESLSHGEFSLAQGIGNVLTYTVTGMVELYQQLLTRLLR